MLVYKIEFRKIDRQILVKTSIKIKGGQIMYIMAFDVSKGKSYMVLYKNHDLIYEGELPHNSMAFDELLYFLKENEVELVFEATGVYSKPLEHLFETNGLNYYCLNPLEVSFQTATLRQMKTDQTDAHRLALSHLNFNRKITVPSSHRYKELKAMSFSYHLVHDELLVNRNYLHSELQYTFPGIEEIYKDNLSQYVLKILEKYPHPDYVIRDSRTKIKNFIKKATQKRISEQQAIEKVKWIQTCAENSYPIVNKDSFRVKQVRKRIQNIDRLITEKKEIREDLISEANVLSEFSILESIPGIGELTSALLLAELGDIRRFETNKQLNAYVGIDIRRYRSGTIYKKDRIQKRGNKRARKILYYTVQNMIKRQKYIDNHIIDYYYKMKKEPYTKKHKVAMIACMNRLLKTIHYLINTQQEYDYTKSPRS